MPTQRIFLIICIFFLTINTHNALAITPWEVDRLTTKMTALEASTGGRLGLMAVYTGNGSSFAYKADERFPFCSTFKFVLVSAILSRSMEDPTLLQKTLTVPTETVSHSPVTAPKSGQSMTVEELCAAAMEVSDNTATNMLLDLLGGPPALRPFASRMQAPDFRLDRMEPQLNTARPKDIRDTATPRAMVTILQNALLGDGLDQNAKKKLEQWLRQCQTGQKRIAAALPTGWSMGHKTGSGDYGTTNDIAIVWPQNGAPILLGIYLTQTELPADDREDVLRQVAKELLTARF